MPEPPPRNPPDDTPPHPANPSQNSALDVHTERYIRSEAHTGRTPKELKEEREDMYSAAGYANRPEGGVVGVTTRCVVV